MSENVSKESIKDLEVFKGLSDDEYVLISDICSRETFEKDAILFNEGEFGRKLYIIEEGRLICESEARQNNRIIVGQEGKGGICGWSAAVEPYIYTSTSRAVEKTKVIVIDAARMQDICHLHSNICAVFKECLLNTVVKRLADLRKYVAVVMHYSQGHMD
ncbi:MAG: cyclic nucleotide-binding domain-containing protein [Spirochaetales bacterium]|nr:cyclic nucleotide-binding domain-containing protein [Spirochaetales bacterium]